MTRARTKQLQDAISAFVMRIWDDNQLYNVGGAKNNSLKTPCTILQSDLSSSSAPPCTIQLAECGRYIHEEMHERESSTNEKIHAWPGSMLGGS
ncbi:hypothetical protein PVK06_008477 [Gossypium arboreum]|uniref:Uncharacterized protein n=1 Tax=Gossypium arboreum TaxID=29729 RepID=A0ABR0QK07_GOSAR|nr:hypothetical protein PVK06_008477 [Gossypium arboreum]